MEGCGASGKAAKGSLGYVGGVIRGLNSTVYACGPLGPALKLKSKIPTPHTKALTSGKGSSPVCYFKELDELDSEGSETGHSTGKRRGRTKNAVRGIYYLCCLAGTHHNDNSFGSRSCSTGICPCFPSTPNMQATPKHPHQTAITPKTSESKGKRLGTPSFPQPFVRPKP